MVSGESEGEVGRWLFGVPGGTARCPSGSRAAPQVASLASGPLSNRACGWGKVSTFQMVRILLDGPDISERVEVEIYARSTARYCAEWCWPLASQIQFQSLRHTFLSELQSPCCSLPLRASDTRCAAFTGRTYLPSCPTWGMKSPRSFVCSDALVVSATAMILSGGDWAGVASFGSGDDSRGAL